MTGLFEDRGDDLQLVAAVGAMLHVDLEHEFEQLGPAQSHWWSMVRAACLALGSLYGLGGRLGLLRHHQRAQLCVGYQHALEADQMQPWPGHQRRQPLHKLQRRHRAMRGAVAPGVLSLSTTWPAAWFARDHWQVARDHAREGNQLVVPAVTASRRRKP
jgi:hypothetical protein